MNKEIILSSFVHPAPTPGELHAFFVHVLVPQRIHPLTSDIDVEFLFLDDPSLCLLHTAFTGFCTLVLDSVALENVLQVDVPVAWFNYDRYEVRWFFHTLDELEVNHYHNDMCTRCRMEEVYLCLQHLLEDWARLREDLGLADIQDELCSMFLATQYQEREQEKQRNEYLIHCLPDRAAVEADGTMGHPILRQSSRLYPSMRYTFTMATLWEHWQSLDEDRREFTRRRSKRMREIFIKELVKWESLNCDDKE